MTNPAHDSVASLLPWDSAFFNLRIARVNGHLLDRAKSDAIDEWSCENKADCLYFVASADDAETARTAESNGYHLVDLRLTFERKVNNSDSANARSALEPAVAADLPDLEMIASTAHRDTRFYYDPNFPRDRCDELYRTWIRNSFAGYAKAVLVARSGDTAAPAGYITCHVDESGGSIGLVAVRDSARGGGIGGQLVAGALSWFAANGVASVTVVTQGRNVIAQRLYQRHGFVTQSIQLHYHKWYRR